MSNPFPPTQPAVPQQVPQPVLGDHLTIQPLVWFAGVGVALPGIPTIPPLLQPVLGGPPQPLQPTAAGPRQYARAWPAGAPAVSHPLPPQQQATGVVPVQAPGTVPYLSQEDREQLERQQAQRAARLLQDPFPPSTTLTAISTLETDLCHVVPGYLPWNESLKDIGQVAREYYDGEIQWGRRLPALIDLELKWKARWRGGFPKNMRAKHKWSERRPLIMAVLKTKELRDCSFDEAIAFWQRKQADPLCNSLSKLHDYIKDTLGNTDSGTFRQYVMTERTPAYVSPAKKARRRMWAAERERAGGVAAGPDAAAAAAPTSPGGPGSSVVGGAGVTGQPSLQAATPRALATGVELPASRVSEGLGAATAVRASPDGAVAGSSGTGRLAAAGPALQRDVAEAATACPAEQNAANNSVVGVNTGSLAGGTARTLSFATDAGPPATPVAAIAATSGTALGSTPATAIAEKPANGIAATPATTLGATSATALGATSATTLGATPATAIAEKPVVGIAATPATAIATTSADGVVSTPATALGSTPATGIVEKTATAIAATPATAMATTSGGWQEAVGGLPSALVGLTTAGPTLVVAGGGASSWLLGPGVGGGNSAEPQVAVSPPAGLLAQLQALATIVAELQARGLSAQASALAAAQLVMQRQQGQHQWQVGVFGQFALAGAAGPNGVPGVAAAAPQARASAAAGANVPRPPTSAYNMFYAEACKHAKEWGAKCSREYPEIVARRWRSMTDAERRPYEEAYETAMHAYEAAKDRARLGGVRRKKRKVSEV